MTAQGPRKGESSRTSMRNGFRTQPARLVRGSSRRIMTMRFRPANIRVINRRVCSWAVIRLLSKTKTPCSKLHQRERVPTKAARRWLVHAGTVLAVKGSLRRAKQRRALDCCAPFRRDRNRDGRLRREHSAPFCTQTTKGRLSSRWSESRPDSKHHQTRRGLTGSLHIRSLPVLPYITDSFSGVLPPFRPRRVSPARIEQHSEQHFGCVTEVLHGDVGRRSTTAILTR
jgi:hypothetical protein